MRGTQGLTVGSSDRNYGGSLGGDAATSRSTSSMQSFTLKARAIRLKQFANREVSERRQVGDAEELVNAPLSSDSGVGGKPHWWRNVGMDEGL